MTVERWNRIQEVFLEALETTTKERIGYLDRACAGDPGLRREVESLLACDAPQQRLAEITGYVARELVDPEQDLAGRRVGPYRLKSLIGHGGMGAVYLGVRDDDQYQKQVAIKLLKRGMDTDFMLSRFRQERQILATLEHPFIARLLDGGATDDGLPYFVMEYVDGVPITTYCRDNGLSIPERLRLFRLVCEAIQYAHQNLVVHRDIKPSNILTTREGVPKLLDFGIAKVVDPQTPGIAETRRELRMLTPEYASPEQVRGLPISTASDTYSLGTVLYELLAGQRAHQFPSEMPADIERTICEAEPARPSMVASQNLARQLRGDLDNIVLVAMRKEPERRYASAAEFSQDLQRHLDGLPVLAREHRWSYQAGKFIRRNRVLVGAAGLLVASLVAGIVATTMQARRAERRFLLARQLASAVVAEVKGPMERIPGSTAARASMIQTVIRYLDGLAKDPGKDPAFELEIANAYREVASVEAHPFRPNLGQPQAALEHFEKAISIYRKWADREDTKVWALAGLIGANVEAGDVESRNGNPAAANARLQQVAAIAAAAMERDPKAVTVGAQVYLYFRMLTAETRAGNVQVALGHGRKALDLCRQWAQSDSSVNARNTLRGAYDRFAGSLKRAGDLYASREHYEATLRLAEEGLKLPDAGVYDRSRLSGAHQNLADILANPIDLNFGDGASALLHSREAISIAEAIAAADPRDVRARDDLAGSLRSGGEIALTDRPAEAIQAFERAAALSEELRKGDPGNTKYRRDVAFSRMEMSEALHRLGRSREAISLLGPALETIRSVSSGDADDLPTFSEVGRAHRDLGDALLAVHENEAAMEHYRQALAVTDELLRRAPSNPYFQRYRADDLESLGAYYATLSAGQAAFKAEAREYFGKSLAIWRDWIARKVGSPYAEFRERRAAGMLAQVDRRRLSTGGAQ